MFLRIFLTILILLTPLKSWAVQYWFASSDLLTNASNQFHPPMGYSLVTGTQEYNQCMMSTAGTISDLYVRLSTPPGSTKQILVALRNNGTDTALTCTVVHPDVICRDSTNTASISAGDVIGIRTNATAGFTNSIVRTSMVFTPSSPNEDDSVFCGGTYDYSLSATLPRYISLAAINPSSTDETDHEYVQMIVPTGGTIKRLYVELNSSIGSGDRYIFTVMKENGVTDIDTGVSCTVDNAISCNDTSNSYHASAGSLIYLKADPDSSNPGTRRARVGIAFTPDTPGESFIPRSSSVVSLTLNTSITQFLVPWGIYPAPTIFETGQINYLQEVDNNIIFKNIYAYLLDDPGTSADYYTFTLRREGASTLITCAIDGDDSDRMCWFSTDIAVSDGMYISTQVVPTGSPTAVRALVSYLYEISDAVRRIMMIN